jgi:hypothetical protein
MINAVLWQHASFVARVLCAVQCETTIKQNVLKGFVNGLKMPTKFASKYISLSIKFTALSAMPLIFRGKLWFRDFRKVKECLDFKTRRSGYGGLGVMCWPLGPKFAGSNPAEADF